MRSYEEDFDDLDFGDATLDRMIRKKRKPGRRHASHSHHAAKYMSEMSADFDYDDDFDDDFDDYNSDEFDSYSGYVSRYQD